MTHLRINLNTLSVNLGLVQIQSPDPD